MAVAKKECPICGKVMDGRGYNSHIQMHERKGESNGEPKEPESIKEPEPVVKEPEEVKPEVKPVKKIEPEVGFKNTVGSEKVDEPVSLKKGYSFQDFLEEIL